MKILENEKNLIKLVRLEAIVPILLLSIIMTYYFIHEKNKELNTQIEDLKRLYIQDNKELVKNQVDNVLANIEEEITNSEKNLKIKIKEKVYQAHTIATNIYNNEKRYSKSKQIDEEHILENIKQVLSSMSYNDKRGYFFIDDINGIKILQPNHKEFEGMDFSDFEDVNKYKFVKKIMETIKNRTESYDEYFWYKGDDNINVYKKISFYKYFAPFNFAIGTGEYIDDFENELKESILKNINKIKYGKNGYVFVFDTKGTYLAHFVKDNLGRNGLETQDINKNYFVKDIINFAQKNNEGFFSYVAATKPTAELKNTDKISYMSHLQIIKNNP